MNEEKDTVEETTEEASPETNQEESTEEESEETDTSKGDSIDYEAELEKLQGRLSKAEYTAQSLRKENKRLKKEHEESDGSETSDMDVSSVDAIRSTVREEMRAFESRMFGTRLDEAIKTLSSNESERKLIKLHYENTIHHSDDYMEDLRLAQVLANRNRTQQIADEVQRAHNAKKGTPTGAGQKKRVVKEPALTPMQQALLRDHKFNPKTGRHEGQKTWIKFKPDGGVESGDL